MVLASRRAGSGDFADDYQVRARAVDLLGVPIGVLTQLVARARSLPAAGAHLGGRVHRGAPDGERQGPRRPGVGWIDGAARGDGLRRRPDGRGARLPRPDAGFVRGPCQPPAGWLAASALFTLSTSVPSSTRACSSIGLVCGACALATGRLGMADRLPRRLQRHRPAPGPRLSRDRVHRVGRIGWDHVTAAAMT